MKSLHPSALAKTFAVLGLLMILSNLTLNVLLIGPSLLTSLGKQILISLIATPLIAALAGYIIARLYNYFLPDHQ